MKTINLDLNESCKDIKLGDFIIYDNKTYKFTTNSFKLIEKPIVDNFELLSEFLPELNFWESEVENQKHDDIFDDASWIF